MPSQLNGKRNVARRRRPNPRCPRNGTADEAAPSRPGFSPGAHATGSSRFREGRRGRLRQPGYRPTSGPSLVLRPCRTCPRGSGRVPLSGLFHHVRSSARAAAHRRWPRFACSFSLCPLVRRGAVPARSGRHHRHPRAAGARAAASPTSSSSTPRRSATARADSVEDLLRRVAGVQIARNGGPGQTSGYFVRGASTSSTVVLVDGVRIGSATLGQAEFEALSLSQIERIEVLRGPASSLYGADAVGGVVQIFTRRGEGAPRVDRRGGDRRLPLARRATSASAAREGAFDYALSLGRREQPTACRRCGRATRSAPSIPTDDGFTAQRRQPAPRLRRRPPGHRIGVSLLETRLDAQYDSARVRRRRSPPTRRPTSATG